jgi:hypothetical protein
MKRYRISLVTLILLTGFSLFQIAFDRVAAAEIQISGQIGKDEQAVEPSVEPEKKQELAQPKQTHIVLKKFPDTGFITDKLALIGLLVLLIYLTILIREAHRKRTRSSR